MGEQGPAVGPVGPSKPEVQTPPAAIAVPHAVEFKSFGAKTGETPDGTVTLKAAVNNLNKFGKKEPEKNVTQVEADAINAKTAAEVAKTAAKVANKVAKHSVQITEHAKSALESAHDALHEARVESSGLSKGQKESLKEA